MNIYWLFVILGAIVLLYIVVFLFTPEEKPTQPKPAQPSPLVRKTKSSFEPGKCGSCEETMEWVRDEESRSYGKSAGHYIMEYSCYRCPKCGRETERTYYGGGYWDHA